MSVDCRMDVCSGVQEFWDMKEQLMYNERMLLQTIGMSVGVVCVVCQLALSVWYVSWRCLCGMSVGVVCEVSVGVVCVVCQLVLSMCMVMCKNAISLFILCVCVRLFVDCVGVSMCICI